MKSAANRAHPAKTNACRLLDTLGLTYELLAYPVDLDDLSATHVAEQIGLPPEQVFKTLLAQTATGESVFAVLPGSSELDLKKLARAATAAGVPGAKKMELTPMRVLEPLTGYVRGGCTVLAARKPFPAFVEETVELWDNISVSAGQRGLQLLLTPASYLQATGATLADLIL